ncbi:metallophosphoesterase family protein [Ancylobacter sp. SL191]|uniref:metallophosphoesterase family protein n=1 Tax=Ancylobacter sp. SL191 TaxID=2995166 RepID=UPI00226E34F0|nr:metallophosphoesterase family protein [Ancylobacter sp. SL191]WAC25951.1 metallophosphoesterase family protein [Ancylobacter sp. SL191]
MLFSRFRARAVVPEPPPYSIPAGQRVYAIGDIHGWLDLLDRLLAMVVQDARCASAGPSSARFIFLGDYIDRGPASRQVIDRLIAGRDAAGWICLKGNHEAMLLEALDGRRDFDVWLANGGVETLFSYGIVARQHLTAGGEDALRAAMSEAIPPAHLAFLRELPTSHELGGYFFCHAGVRPGVPLERQADDDLLWIREAFINSTADHGRRVVHGHTPVMASEILPNRINVDTGAYLTHRLSCAVLEAAEVRVLTT